ncbi:MAG: restriction endonuclease [Methanoregulaceae archaeon]|jgi:restriction system protein
MAVPDFQTLMLPVLQYYGDKLEHTKQETINTLAVKLKLTKEEINDLLPSGNQYRYDNRVGWAITYLVKSGLLNRTSRGRYVITNRGLDVIKEKPEKINMKYLEKFPEYVEFKSFRREIEPKIDDSEISTPQEQLESSYLELRTQLSHDLLNRVMKSSPTFFEKLVVKLLVELGYGGSRIDAGQAIGRSGDDGIDGIIKEDKLGLDVVNIQAKRWEKSVGRPEIQAFAGSLEGQRSKKGVFITTSKFTPDAHEYVKRIEKKIVLIDGEQLTQLMIDHGVGVTEESRYIINKMDEDFFSDE